MEIPGGLEKFIGDGRRVLVGVIDQEHVDPGRVTMRIFGGRCPVPAEMDKATQDIILHGEDHVLWPEMQLAQDDLFQDGRGHRAGEGVEVVLLPEEGNAG